MHRTKTRKTTRRKIGNGPACSARNLGYDVVVVRDCVGSRNRELHDMALKLMEQSHFDFASAGDIADIWREK